MTPLWTYTGGGYNNFLHICSSSTTSVKEKTNRGKGIATMTSSPCTTRAQLTQSESWLKCCVSFLCAAIVARMHWLCFQTGSFLRKQPVRSPSNRNHKINEVNRSKLIGRENDSSIKYSVEQFKKRKYLKNVYNWFRKHFPHYEPFITSKSLLVLRKANASTKKRIAKKRVRRHFSLIS